MKKKIKFTDIIKRFEKDTLYIERDTVQELFSIIDQKSDELDEYTYHSLSNYMVIRLVSAVEYYFQNRARELIDKNNMDVSGIFEKDEIIISLNELDEIPRGNITKGRIVSYAINFQNFDEVNRVFSKLLQVKNFENEIRKQHHTFVYSAWGKVGISFNFDKILELINIRHKIVHEMTNFQGDFQELKMYLANCIMLFSIINEVISQKLRNLP